MAFVYLDCFFRDYSSLGHLPKEEPGYWRQQADERFGDSPPKVDPGAFSGQRQGWKTPKRTPWQCTASVCIGSALLADLLGVSRSMERDLLSVLSIYPRIFLFIFTVYRHIVRILCLLLYSAIC